MTFAAISLHETDGVARLTLDRPDKLNALDVRMAEELCAALDALGRSPTVRVLVLTGAGRMFSAGGDLDSMEQVVASAAAVDQAVRLYCEVVRRLWELPLPVVARVNGDAFGGALGMIMACDLRIARDEARLGFVFTRVGLSGADAGVTYLLPRLVGVSKAVELLLLGETIVATEAERLGLLQRAVPGAQLDAVTDDVVARLAAGPPLALRRTKRALHDGLTRDIASALECEAYIQSLCFQSEDHREGVVAFRERRAPVFRGR